MRGTPEEMSLCNAVDHGGIERGTMGNSPGENKVIRRVQETEETDAEEDLLCDEEVQIVGRRL
jgi:hypothetical protein